MSDDVVTVRISRDHAAFLQANLSALAATTRQAMARPGLEHERHMALGSRAIVLEIIEDVIRSAMMDVPNNSRKSGRGEEVVDHPHGHRQPRRLERSVTTRAAALSLRLA